VADRHYFFHPEAERELEEAASWYDERSPGLGVEFVANVRSKVEQILESPELSAPQPVEQRPCPGSFWPPSRSLGSLGCRGSEYKVRFRQVWAKLS